MNAVAFPYRNRQSDFYSLTTKRRFRTNTQLAGTLFGLAGGVTAGISGSMLTLASWLVADAGARHWLSTAGSALLLLTIPLIILAGCCMDWLENDDEPRSSKPSAWDEEDL